MNNQTSANAPTNTLTDEICPTCGNAIAGSDPHVCPETLDTEQLSPVRAMYARLAKQYDARPTVPDCGGGVKGDRYPF